MLEELFRKDLEKFASYKVEDNNCKVVLDSNESFINIPKDFSNELIKILSDISFNRYPDPLARKVCQEYLNFLSREYSNLSDISIENMIAGNGSDELIQIILSTFTKDGDRVIIPSPNFSMYSIYSELAGAQIIDFPSGGNFQVDVDSLIEKTNWEGAKILFISNPNNPTGEVISPFDLVKILENTNAIVVIDEAYGEFYGKTVLDKINKYEHLIVLKTCSKIGLAAIRLGFLITNSRLMNEIKKVKPPYNTNTVTQEIGAFMLSQEEVMHKSIANIIKERSYLFRELSNFENLKIYPSMSNFILVEAEDGKKLYESLVEANVSVRAFKQERLKNCLRITVGSRAENFWLISHLKVILGK